MREGRENLVTGRDWISTSAVGLDEGPVPSLAPLPLVQGGVRVQSSEFGITRARACESREREASACVVVLKQRGVTPRLMTGPNEIFRF